MSTHPSPLSPQETQKLVVQRFVQLGVFVAVMAALLFLTAGRIDWLGGWLALGSYLALIGVTAWLVLPKHQDLVAERAQMQANVKPWDKVLSPLISLVGWLGTLAVAGLDVRFHWAPPFSLPVQLVGLALVCAGYALVVWAMTSNTFFSSFVRIQTERGHHVVNQGPYRLVRHPGYLGGLLSTLGVPFLLGSICALGPAALALVLIIVRTALEDRTLQAELPGYLEYTRITRWRLLPGVW